MAAVSPHASDRVVTAYLKKGRAFYSQKKYDQAIKAFEKAITLCNCGISVQNQPCINDAILTGIVKDKLKDALASLSATTRRCDNQAHIDALDSLIATFEMQARFDECLEYAVKMVNLSPRDPKAYLRLGKILRLQKQPNLAYHTYKQGIELVKRKHPHHALLKSLQAQREKAAAVATFDPIMTFPIEIVRMIFKHLEFKVRCRCLCVSKTWQLALTVPSVKDIWQCQVYKFAQRNHPGLRRMPTTFRTYGEYAAHALTELSIDGCSHFLTFCKLPQVLAFSKQLKVLKIREPRGSFDLDALPWQKKEPQLTNLSLGYGVRPTPAFLRQMLLTSSDSLEELSIFELPLPPETPNQGDRLWYTDWPKLEKLKVVRFASPWYLDSGRHSLDLRSVVDLIPNVQEAWIDHLHYSPMDMMHYWPNLRSVFIGRGTNVYWAPTEDVGPCFNKDMRELHLEGHDIADRICRREPPQITADPQAPWVLTVRFGELAIPNLSKLEKLSLLFHVAVESSVFETILRPGLTSGTLREIDVRPLPAVHFFQDLREPTVPEWFRSESVTYLSLTGFAQEFLHEHKLFEKVILEIASRFPNLESVDIAHERFPDSLLAKLIQGGVKTIYHRTGHPRADLREWATAKHRAQLISRPPSHLPSMHPDRHRFFNELLAFSNAEFP
ncbi:hypothetical protein F5Y04DRAFT_288641 [Hypomontagnella monticulosa]|nr:hypothetical protein F5Y04DRAFT_288641 [Hypomontagnella monticulosa]